MKKSELRQLIREELRKLNEGRIPLGKQMSSALVTDIQGYKRKFARIDGQKVSADQIIKFMSIYKNASTKIKNQLDNMDVKTALKFIEKLGK